MLTVTTDELAAKLAAYLDRVAHGEEICIIDHGRAIARLVSDRMRLRERLASAVAAGEVELGSLDDVPAPVPAAIGGTPASDLLAQDRAGRDDSLTGGQP